MVLRKVLEKHRPALRVFKHAGEQGGVLENLVELSNELKRAGVTVPQFGAAFEDRLAAGEQLPVLFKEKVGDLLLILTAMAEELGEQYLDAEDYLDLLAAQAGHSSFLKGAAIWVDGFHQFTNQEYGVLAELLRFAQMMTVTLCFDGKRGPGGQLDGQPHEQPGGQQDEDLEERLDGLLDELDLFYPVARTYQKLLQMAAACRFPVEKIYLHEHGQSRFAGRLEPAHLEENLFYYPVRPYSGRYAGFLRLASAPNRRCEVESLAREIIRRARDENYRWRDLAVICSSLDDYREIIATIFGDYDLPFFLDQARSVLHHPLVEFIRSALEVVNRNWRYSAVFHCFKTEFLFPLVQEKEEQQKWRERTDQLENYVLAFGIQGGHWRQAEPWQFLSRDTLDYVEAQAKEEAGELARAGGKELLSGEERIREKDLSSREEQVEEKRALPGGGQAEGGGFSSGEGQAGKERFSPREDAYLQLLQVTRQKLGGPLLRWEEKFKAASTVKEKTAALYELLAENSVWERLELWSREALESGNPERAREHLQVYKGVIDLFDQLVEIMGEEKIAANLYARLVETGLENLRLSLVPPSLDQVFVGDLKRSRPGPVKYVYLLGANDGYLPALPREDGIFSDEEREIAGGWGVELAPGGQRRLLDEQFLIYLALTRATDGLRVSYPLADEEGRALLPSLFVVHLKELFPALAEELLAMEPEPGSGSDAAASVGDNRGEAAMTADPDGYEIAIQDSASILEQTAETLLSYVAHPRRALSHLAVQLSHWKKGAALHPFWWDLYNWYVDEKTWHAAAEKLLGGVFYRNLEQPLGAATSRQLYGQQLQTSVSRLELFRSCPFAHFATYGLRLRERPVYRLEAPDIGRFFHAVLRNFTLSLQEKGLNWGELEKEECLQLVDTEVELLVPKLQQEILLSSGRYRYLAGKLKDTVGEAALTLGEQDRKSSFKPVGVELFFGRGGALPALDLALEDGSRVELIGRIDRVDLAYDQKGSVYLRVLDYKAGRTGFSLAEVCHGLALQLCIYLDVVLAHAPQWLKAEALPAGLLYFRVHAPLIRAPHPLLPSEIEKEIRKRYQMKGMVLADKEVVRLMDNSLEVGRSALIPVGFTKQGNFYKDSATFTAERYFLLREYLRWLVKKTAKSIIGGEVAIAPYSMGKSKACTYCPYRAVCQFDLSLTENEYRLLREEQAEKIWSGLEKKNGERD